MSDSIWAMVLGAAKMMQMTPKEILYDVSYKNIVLYSKSMPSFTDVPKRSKDEDGDQPLYDETKDANATSKTTLTNGKISRRV